MGWYVVPACCRLSPVLRTGGSSLKASGLLLRILAITGVVSAMVAALVGLGGRTGSTGVLLCALLVVAISAPLLYLAAIRPLTDALSRLGALSVAEEQVRKLSRAVEQSPTLVLIAAADGTIEYVNASFTRVTGLTAEELMGQHVRVLRLPETSPEEYDRFWESITSVDEWHGEIHRAMRGGEERWEQITVSPIRNADGQPTHYLILMVDVTERKRNEEALRHSEERTGAFIAAMPDIVAEIDTQGRFAWLNDEGLEFFGADAVGKSVVGSATGSEERRRLKAQLQGLLDGTTDFLKTESLQHRADGEDRLLSWVFRPLTDDGQTTGVVATARDITLRKRAEAERRELEQQLHQLQKMEAISRLAGGVAHDFNNMLAAILGYAELSLMRLEDEHAACRWVEQIRETSLRAANLTRQLLAFSRRQVFELKPLSLNDILMSLHPMLRRLIPENIELVTIPGEGLGAVMADAGQVEQVVINLAVNARDAMPDGGTLLLETANVELDEEYARTHASIQPGPHVRLSVTDTGCGMSKQVQQHLFEPFFTTKELGRGTGLGLATVYGIVKQLGGSIWVYSEPGQGTTFKIYLPRVEAPAEPLTAAPANGSMPGGTETVLVVDDEPVVRSVTGQSLRQLGYSVLEAANSAEALHVLSSYPGPVHLLFTDVVMPGMGGRQLAETATRLRPRLRTLYMSGHTDNAIVHEGVLDEGVAFLQKPFTVSALAHKVRQVLDG